MSFLESDFISRELQEIEFLQKRVLEQSYILEQFLLNGYTEVDQLADHLHTLYALCEKQHVVYIRLSLTDDEEALHLKDQVKEAAIMCGMHPLGDVSRFYSEMKEELKSQIQELTGEDLDDIIGLE